MVGSKSVAHITPLSRSPVKTNKNGTDITLTNASAVSLEEIGMRSVRCMADGVENNVSMSGTLFLPERKTSLLSVQALMNEKIPVLFLLAKPCCWTLGTTISSSGMPAKIPTVCSILLKMCVAKTVWKKTFLCNTDMIAKVMSVVSFGVKIHVSRSENRDAGKITAHCENIF